MECAKSVQSKGVEMIEDKDLALRRAQAFNESLSRHVMALMETTRKAGAPNAPTLIKACEQMLRAAWKAGNEAGEPLDVKKEPLLSGSVREETPHRWGTIRP
jgi:hypothetical protein